MTGYQIMFVQMSVCESGDMNDWVPNYICTYISL